MLEDDFTDDLLEDETILAGLYFLGGFGEDPAFEFGVGVGVDHVYLGEEGVEVGEVVDFLEVQNHLLLLQGGLAAERLDGDVRLVALVGGLWSHHGFMVELAQEQKLLHCFGTNHQPHSLQPQPLLLLLLQISTHHLHIKQLAAVAAELDLPPLLGFLRWHQ
jgi:hypothetical protein